MHILRADFLFLQETHRHVTNIRDRYYNSCFHSVNPETKSRGASIAVHMGLHHEIFYSTDGRLIFLKVRLWGQLLTLASLYLPNIDQIWAFCKILANLWEFGGGYHGTWRGL
ncbi:hypothetical protein GDO81_005314 [Engystomops pustulosus]|uniref:Uncharacterized protein n=1 Tax=Engystomops pustulosus TaxID=76066 RepID=A0AAV7CNT9_ENGPU|nr:hypothetical protein GDO81_005314 [Engystomops pustulosus]